MYMKISMIEFVIQHGKSVFQNHILIVLLFDHIT